VPPAATPAGCPTWCSRGSVRRGRSPCAPSRPRAARRGVHRSLRAEQQHRHAVAPGVEDRHGRVHQPDIAVQPTAIGRPVTLA
jgi:hypothetical protein